MIRTCILKVSILLISICLLQSCYTYKTTTVNKIEIGKKYRIKVADGREITNECIGFSADSLTFKARNRQLNFLKSDVEKIERKRNSPMTYVAAAAVPIIIILSATTNKKESFFDKTSPSERN